MQIIAEKLSKKYSSGWIFKNFNKVFETNKAYGFAGPNGSGKSTMLQVLSGMIPPSQGKLMFAMDGKAIHEDQWYREVSFAAPYAELYDYMKLHELLRHHLQFKTLYEDISLNDLVEWVQVKDHSSKYIKSYSSGMKQRLKLALAICTKSNLLVLDEPQTNLDEWNAAWYIDLLQRYRHNRIVMIASNLPSDFLEVDEIITLSA